MTLLCGNMCIYIYIWEFPKIRVPFQGGSHYKDYTVLGCILGSPYFGKLPYIYIYIVGNIGIMEKKMETTIIMGYMGDYRVCIYRGYIGIMEKKMETTI